MTSRNTAALRPSSASRVSPGRLRHAGGDDDDAGAGEVGGSRRRATRVAEAKGTAWAMSSAWARASAGSWSTSTTSVAVPVSAMA